jgi:hypothetical protein
LLQTVQALGAHGARARWRKSNRRRCIQRGTRKEAA